MIDKLVIVLVFVGIIMVMANEQTQTRPDKVVYRYLPRDLDDYIRTAPLASDMYSTMFSDKDVV